jgi:uncharacterized protein involved in exopolysaccharide biosynthesis
MYPQFDAMHGEFDAMHPQFDAFEYVDYLRRRWRVLAIACVAAVFIAGAVSLLLPKQYTATARIVIEPPGGGDPRLATAVSAMYLESLKTYELFGNSETLFARAAAKFHLQSSPSQSLESLQHRVLKVAKVRDTKVLEVSATLHDPNQAQALAQYVAEETVSMSRGESLASDHDFSDPAEKQVAEARKQLAEIEKSWNALAVEGPVDTLQSEIDADIELRGKVEEQLAAAESEAAEYQRQSQDGGFAREQWESAQARAAVLAKRSRELQAAISEKTRTLATRTARRDTLANALKVAQQAYQTVSGRLLESRAMAGTHAEQLRIIDPGTVPERPSSPNTPLNVIAALFAALVLSLSYLTFAFVFGRGRNRFARSYTHEEAREIRA